MTESPSSAAPEAPRLTWRAKAALLAFGLGLMAAVELLLRLSGVAPPPRLRDPLVEGGAVDRAYAPGALPGGEAAHVCPWIRPEFPANFQPIPLRKTSGEVRIFVFGGSSSVGYPHDGRLAFSSFLEAGLNAVLPAGRRARVLNVAQNGIPAGTCLRLMREMADYAPDLFVVYSGNNEYANDHVYRNVRRGGRVVAGARGIAVHLALYRLIERALLPARARVHAAFFVGDSAAQAPAYSETERRLIADNYAYVMAAMTELCAERNIGLLLCSVAANEADWPPYRSTFRPATPAAEREAWRSAFARAIGAWKAGNADAVLELVSGLEAVDDARADLHFLAGRALLARGRTAEAAARFTRALDLDNVCYRARPSQNELARRAAATGGADFADVVAALRRAGAGAPLGEALFWDHCHPRPATHEMIALCAAEALFEAGRLPQPADGWRARWGEAVRRYRDGVRLSPADRARALRNAASGWMGLWTSHRGAEDLLRDDPAILARALEYLDKAVETDPRTPGSRFYRGVIFAQLGQRDRALADWREELALGSSDGPLRDVLEGLLAGRIPPDRGFDEWLFIRNDMVR